MCDWECESRVFDVVFLYALKPAEHNNSEFIGAFLKEYFGIIDPEQYI